MQKMDKTMDLAALEIILKEQFPDLRGKNGHWDAMTKEGFRFYCLTDTHHDRMRFMIPVMRLSNPPSAFLFTLLEANFHKALDANYAVHDGLLWATFVHPLRSLSHSLARDAVKQVVTLALNTGTSYSSGSLVFMGGSKEAAKHKEGLRLTQE